MIRFLLFFLLSTALLSAAPEKINAPIKNFRLPSFNKAGVRVSLLRGTEALYLSSSQIELHEMNLSLFHDDGTARVDTVLLSPSAVVTLGAENQLAVNGEETVRLIRDDVEATGERWHYDHTGKRLSLRKNVRVIFQAPIENLIQ